ncbi:MAG: DUF393 domain-containing protein [Candidatus Hydrogenedentes bacterium]|nr:DUF393 domain-containing protein [Candidatus Hydrogenedentota bacterium]MBI3119921.1 DUF393 domain-containing protein [Candidatus Hydrogenedentota bacterium]
MTPALLIYDASCPVCRRAQSWIARRARPNCLDYVPCQSEARKARAPQVSEDECMRAMQLILPEGTIFAGADAFEHLLPLLRAPWRFLRAAFLIPGVRRIAPILYAFIARHRMSVSGLLIRKENGASCDLNKGRR